MNSYTSLIKSVQKKQNKKEVTREEAEQAIKTILEWIGEDPGREGLLETPKRVIKAFSEHFGGYDQDPKEILLKTFEETESYDDMVLLKNIEFESHCEHHMLPIIGFASIAYFPDKEIVGISKLARLLNLFAKRLQTQEVMTAQIINAIETHLKPIGSAVFIEAEHHCMKSRGVHKQNSTMVTSQFRGCFANDKSLQDRFLGLIKQ